MGLGQRALGVPLSRLIDPPKSDIRVIRAGEGVVMHAERDPYEAAMLASCPPGARRDIYRVGAAPGSAHLARPHTAGTVEHLILGTGRVLAGPEGEAVELGPGDRLRYLGDVPHIFHALSSFGHARHHRHGARLTFKRRSMRYACGVSSS